MLDIQVVKFGLLFVGENKLKNWSRIIRFSVKFEEKWYTIDSDAKVSKNELSDCQRILNTLDTQAVKFGLLPVKIGHKTYREFSDFE